VTKGKNMMNNPFEPRTDEERVIDAVERLKFDVQYALQAAMAKHDVKRSELAQRLGISKARVSQMFADDANLRLNTVAKAFAVLDEEIYFGSESVPPIREKQSRTVKTPASGFPTGLEVAFARSKRKELEWLHEPAETNRTSGRHTARQQTQAQKSEWQIVAERAGFAAQEPYLVANENLETDMDLAA